MNWAALKPTSAPAANDVGPGAVERAGGFSEQGFKAALAKLASGVAIVACWDGVAPRGVLVSSLIGLSVSPPRMLFSVRHDASAHFGLLKSGCCTATILADSDRGDAELFSASATAEQRFASSRWDLTDSFAPRFAGGIVAFDLRVEKRIRAESHTIFIARAASREGGDGAPLVYFERQLHALSIGDLEADH